MTVPLAVNSAVVPAMMLVAAAGTGVAHAVRHTPIPSVCGVPLGIGHLRGNGALPNQLVPLELAAAQHGREFCRGTKHLSGGTNCFVGLLCVLGLADVDARGG